MLTFKQSLVLASASLLGLITSAHAVSGIEITREATHQSSALYTETAVDMRVQTASGSLAVTRYFHNGQWQFFSQWSDLNVSSRMAKDGAPAEMTFNEWAYKKQAGSATLYRFDEKNIIIRSPNRTNPAAKWRWQNTNGRWIDFNANGQSIATGRFALTYFTVTRNANGDITNVRDQKQQNILTVAYHQPKQVKSITDYAGRVVTYTYTNGNLSSIIDVLGQKWDYTYRNASVKGKTQAIITSRTEPSGRKLDITYQQTAGGKRCVSGTNYAWTFDTTSNTWKASYDKCTDFVDVQGMLMLKSLKDQLGVIKSFAYDYNPRKRVYTFVTLYPNGRRTSRVVDLQGRTVRRSSNGRDTSRTVWLNNNRESLTVDVRGHETVSKYDQWGNALQTVNADGAVEKWSYQPNTNLVTEYIAANGVKTTYAYNANGQQTQMVEAVGSDKQRTTVRAYDSFGQLTSITVKDNNGNAQTTTYGYDNHNNISTVTDAESYVTKREDFTPTGQPKTITNAENEVTRVTYDNAGNILSQQTAFDQANNAKTSMTYDAIGSLTTVTSPSGLVTTTTYDLRSRQKTVTTPTTGKTTYHYANAQLTSIESADGATVTYVYDAEGNVKTQTDAMGNVTAYDNGTKANNTYPDMLNKITYPTYSESYAYDKLNRRVKTTKTDPTGNLSDIVTEQAYDNVGNLAYSIDGNGQKTSYGYDALSRQISETNEATQETTTYDYDVFGNLLGVTNAKGTTIRTYTYDKLGQTKTEETPDGRTITFVYDKVGNLIKKTNPAGQIETHTYVNNQLKTTRYYQNATTQANNTIAEEITYTYDADGRLKTAIHKVDNKLSDKYEYTYNNGLLSQQKTTFYDENGVKLFDKALAYTYHPDGQLKTYTNAEGVTVNYAYNANQQLTKLTIPTVGDIIRGDFKWQAPQQITYPNSVTTDYQFDALMRTKQIHTHKASTEIMKYDYVYDKVGNIIRKTTEKGVSNYTYDKAYRLTGATHPTLTNETFSYDKVGNRLTSASTTGNWTYNNSDQLLTTPLASYDYTANGNIKKITPADTTQKVSEYIYDARDRLAEVKKDNTVLQSNRYDFQQRRIVKATTSGTTYFLYGQTGLLAEYQANGDFIQGYGYNPKGSYTTNPQYTITPKTGTVYDFDFYHNDDLATPQKLTNSTGAVSWAMESTAFGEVTIKAQTTPNNLRFSGQYADSEIDLSQNYFRDYAPNLGRYVETDPIGLRGGINTYAYVTSNPLSLTDPRGQDLFGNRPGKKPVPGCYGRKCGMPPDANPDYRPCLYYLYVSLTQGCNYHKSAYKVCTGSSNWFAQVANALLSTCTGFVYSERYKNCVRKCLVEKDKQARKNPKCQLNCDGGVCTKRACIDDYHEECFKRCGVPTSCYGGNWDNWGPFHKNYYDD